MTQASQPKGTGHSISLVTGPDAAVDAVLERHHAAMRAASPEESCHVMTADALRASGAKIFALRDASGEVCAIGALKAFGAHAVELKSMHTLSEHRGKGLARVLLARLLEAAREMDAHQAYLETGSEPGFAPARALYESAGFTYCVPFGDYVTDPLSVFMCRPL